MSDRLKCTNQASNEEIIEDITKDLKSTMNSEEKAEEFVINPSTSADEAPTASGDAAKTPEQPHSKIPPVDLTKEELEKDPDEKEDEKEEDSDSDAIDEESLKDVELTLTDDQKEERKVIVEELKDTGNYAFKIGDYNWSVEKYTQGLQNCPLQFTQLRAMLFCNRSAARMKQLKYEKAIKDCTKAIELDPSYLKAYVRRAQSYEAREKLDESLADYKKVLELEPNQKEALKAIVRLPPLIEEKNEKLKTEMLGKLKDLGNMILKPFGLSTENFQMEQDPDTKGYKINFKQ